ncbi:MAG: ABC transporter substrate-binding protein [Nitrospinota bacterium]|nr:MAG: ABC transporter substrate-binding protein [Nitrospinota bacterium]
MRKVMFWLAVALVWLGSFSLLTAGAVTQGGTLIIALGADPAGGLDPESVMNNESGFIMATLYDSLTAYKPGTAEVVPGLAKSWDISADGKTYTFHLREGVSFHDGTPFNAQTYIQALDRLLDENHPYFYKKQEGVSSMVAYSLEPTVASYKAVDDMTVQITLKTPYAPFLSDLAMVWLGVVSPKAVEKYGFDVSKHPVGTGPFTFVEWVPNDHVTVQANPNYWREKPKLDRIIFRVVPEGSVRALKLQKGEVHIMADVPPETISRLERDPNVVVLRQAGLTVNGIGIPRRVKPFDDVRVRRALNYAVNKEEMNKFLYRGIAVPMKSPIPPVLWGYNDSLEGYPYNPEKAKQLLKAAGYPDGFSTELYAYPNPRGYNSVGAKMATAVQGYWAQIGVKAKIVQLEWGAYLRTVRSKDFAKLNMRGWSGDNGDPDNFLFNLFHSSRLPTAFAGPPEIDALIEQARVVTDQAKRVALYKEIQARIMEDAPWVFINHTQQVRAISKKVHGFRLNPLQMFFNMEQVWMEQ